MDDTQLAVEIAEARTAILRLQGKLGECVRTGEFGPEMARHLEACLDHHEFRLQLLTALLPLPRPA